MRVFTVFAVICMFAYIAASDSLDARRVRGVQKAHIATYEETITAQMFTCLNGQGKIPADRINDEFCDCADGSDEPGTAACTFILKKPSNWKFQCTNKGYPTKEFPHSRVNDGLCDCCDGSDEYLGFAKCENRCAEVAEAEEREEREREALRQAGLKVREDMVAKAKEVRARKEAELKQKEANVEANKAKLPAAEAAKKEAEAKEKVKRDEIHENSKAEHEVWKVEQEAKKKVTEEEAAQKMEADENVAAEPTAEEKATNEDTEAPLFVCNGWRQTGGCKGDGPREAHGDKGCHDAIEGGSSGYCACIDTRSGEERKFPKDCGHRRLTCAFVCEHEGEEEEDLPHPLGPIGNKDKEEEFKVDDGSSFVLPEAAEARKAFDDISNAISNDEREIEELKKFKEESYGPEDALLALYDDCVEMDDGREYIYKLCPFKDVQQNKRAGGYGSTSMGKWKGWGQQTYGSWGGSKDFSRMVFENGDHCYSAGARQAEVHVICGAESKIMSIEEPSMCKYKVVFQTPGVCE